MSSPTVAEGSAPRRRGQRVCPSPGRQWPCHQVPTQAPGQGESSGIFSLRTASTPVARVKNSTSERGCYHQRQKVYCFYLCPDLALVPPAVLLNAPRPALPRTDCSARKTGAPRRPVIADDRCFPTSGANKRSVLRSSCGRSPPSVRSNSSTSSHCPPPRSTSGRRTCATMGSATA